jgi:hypothetical protein
LIYGVWGVYWLNFTLVNHFSLGIMNKNSLK